MAPVRCIPLFVLGTMLAVAQQPDAASLSGRVTDTSGKPIGKVTLLLTSGGRSPNGIPKVQPYRTTTSGDGAYSFAGIEPGAYNLRAERSGYARVVKGAPDFRQLSGSLRLAAGQKMTDVNFALALAGSVAGTIVDAVGNAVSGAEVCLWRLYRQDDGTTRFLRIDQVSGPVIPDAVTDNSGKYVLENVAPGSYYVSAGIVSGSSAGGVFDINGLSVVRNGRLSFSPNPIQRPEGYLTTWYPGAISGDQASPVEIAEGRKLQIDIQLRKTPLYQVKGQLAAAPSSPPFGQLRLNLLTSDGQRSLIAANFDNHGVFEMNGLPPGEYYTTATSTASGSPPPLTRQRLTIVDKDIDGLVLNMPSPVELHGIVTVDGKATNAGLSPPGNAYQGPTILVQLTLAEFPQTISTAAPVGNDGSFTIPGFVPGDYRVRVSSPRGTYVKSVRVGDAEVADSALTLRSGSATMKIALGSPTGSIQASLEPTANGVIPDFIIVVPTAVTPGVSWRYQSYPTTEDGPYLIPNLPPGTYRLYGITPADWTNFDPDTLRRYDAQSVTVNVIGSEPVVTSVQSISTAGSAK